jgi:hypothetical protein
VVPRDGQRHRKAYQGNAADNLKKVFRLIGLVLFIVFIFMYL